MGIYDLTLKVITENANTLKINKTDYSWRFKIECSKCYQLQPNEIVFNSTDEVEASKGHSIVNFLMKCKECKSVFTIETCKSSKFEIDISSGNSSGVISSFECRGCSILEFYPSDGFIIEGLDSGKEFIINDISDIWCEYDDKQEKMINLLEPITWSLSSHH
jgi:hypothetical protein